MRKQRHKSSRASRLASASDMPICYLLLPPAVGHLTDVLVKLHDVLATLCKRTCVWQIPFNMLDKWLHSHIAHAYSCAHIFVLSAA